MKVSVLAENSTARSHCRDSLAEWGLSLYLEVNGIRILFDSGHKGTFKHNAAHLGVDLDAVDFVVLSHHHWDHTGGLRFHTFANKKKTGYPSPRARNSPQRTVIGLAQGF